MQLFFPSFHLSSRVSRVFEICFQRKTLTVVEAIETYVPKIVTGFGIRYCSGHQHLDKDVSQLGF